MSYKSSITPNCIKTKPPSANYVKFMVAQNKQRVEPKLIPEYFSDHIGNLRRPRSTSAGTRKPQSFLGKISSKHHLNKENNPPSLKSLSKPTTPRLLKAAFFVPEIKNSFYDHLSNIETQLDDVYENIEVPEDFFSPVKSH